MVTGFVPAMLAKKNAVHLDVSVMTAAFAFVDRAVKRLSDCGRFPYVGSCFDVALVFFLFTALFWNASGLDEGTLAALLSGLALGCVSKSADAKASTKRACNTINDALVKSGSNFKAFVGSTPG